MSIPPFIAIGDQHVGIYPLAIAIAAVVSVLIVLHRSRGIGIGRTLDACWIIALGALVGGRAAHVIDQWAYFASHIAEALNPAAGGLDGRGALVGAVIGALLAGRLGILPRQNGQIAIAPALALIAVGAWIGCAGAGCGAGREVATLADHPALLVAELRDGYGIVAPRYATQAWGASSALAIAVIALRLRAGMWTTAALLALTLAAIAPLRAEGDAPWAALAIAGICAVAALRFDFLARPR